MVLNRQSSIVVLAPLPVTTAEFLLLRKNVFLMFRLSPSALIPASELSLMVAPSTLTLPPLARIPLTAA